jgi:hypothetical protein
MSSSFILGITDAFSKFVRFTVIPDKSAVLVARALWVHWLVIFGVPQTIVSDQGMEFLNDLQATLWEILNVEHKTTTPFWPRCNQQQEHQHKILAHVLRASLLPNDKPSVDWELVISFLSCALSLCALNKAVHHTRL